MIKRHLQGSWDQNAENVIMHNREPSKLQALALAYSDKVAQFIQTNELVPGRAEASLEKIRRQAIVEMKGAGTLVQVAQAEHTVEGNTEEEEEEEAGDVEEAEAGQRWRQRPSQWHFLQIIKSFPIVSFFFRKGKRKEKKKRESDRKLKTKRGVFRERSFILLGGRHERHHLFCRQTGSDRDVAEMSLSQGVMFKLRVELFQELQTLDHRIRSIMMHRPARPDLHNDRVASTDTSSSISSSRDMGTSMAGILLEHCSRSCIMLRIMKAREREPKIHHSSTTRIKSGMALVLEPWYTRREDAVSGTIRAVLGSRRLQFVPTRISSVSHCI